VQAALGSSSLKGISSAVLESALVELMEQRRELAHNHRLRESARYQRAINRVLECHSTQMKLDVQEMALARHRIDARIVDEEAREYDLETRDLIREFKAVRDEGRNQLLERHNGELSRHTRQWGSRRMARMYNLPSHRVAMLRRQQTLLTVQCRFEEADAVARLLAERTLQNNIEQAKARQRDYEESFTKLKTKQTGEVEFFDHETEIQLAQLKQARRVARAPIDNKKKKMEAREAFLMDAERVWNARRHERMEKITTGTTMGQTFPSLHIQPEEVGKSDAARLPLPQLKTDPCVSRNC
jgi:hypothetical protein